MKDGHRSEERLENTAAVFQAEVKVTLLSIVEEIVLDQGNCCCVLCSSWIETRNLKKEGSLCDCVAHERTLVPLESSHCS